MKAGDVAWKKLNGDVFRTPEFPNIFACFVGMGVQIFISLYGMLVFATLFFSNYMLRPYVFTMSIVSLATMGWVNGFTTSQVLKFFGSVDWFFSAMISSLLLPLWLITTGGFIDIIEWLEDSSSFVPFSSVFFYGCCWLAVSIPLSFHGAYTGFGIDKAKRPCKVNTIRRQIPPQPVLMQL